MSKALFSAASDPHSNFSSCLTDDPGFVQAVGEGRCEGRLVGSRAGRPVGCPDGCLPGVMEDIGRLLLGVVTGVLVVDDDVEVEGKVSILCETRSDLAHCGKVDHRGSIGAGWFTTATT